MNRDDISVRFLYPLIQRLRRSEYLRHITVLFGGTATAAAIPLVTAPIVSRLYSPEDYGLLGLYMAAGAVTGVIADGQYHHAVVTADDDRKALLSSLVSLSFTTLFCLFVATLVSVANFTMASDSLSLFLSPWFYFLPLTCFSGGLALVSNGLATRFCDYRSISRAQIVSTAAAPAISIIAALNGFGAEGLFAGLIGYQSILAAYVTFSQRKRFQSALHQADLKSVLLQARESGRFPLFTLPSALMNNVSHQTPIWILSASGLPAIVGHFSRARQLISLPLNLLASAVATVFKQRASKERKDTGLSINTIRKATTFLLLTGVPMFSFLFLFAPQIFVFVLGPQWREAGDIVRILCPMFFIKYVTKPISTMFYVAGRQREDFFLQILFLALTAGIPLAVFMALKNVTALIYSISVSQSIIYLIYFFRSFSFAHDKAPELVT